MQIVERKTNELIPYERNQKKHDEKQIRNVANSIKRFGWQQPIVIDSHDVVVIGHCRLLAAEMLGLDVVPVTVVEGLTDDEIRELRIADNKSNESAWNDDALAIDLSELSFDGFDFDFSMGNDADEQAEQKYTEKTDALYYEPTGNVPKFSALANTAKYDALIDEINGSSLDDEQKEFLRLAACRHIVFDYHAIAELYAISGKDMQELMERSALVIIDYDKAIANGYVQIKDSIEEAIEELTDDA